MIFIYIQVSRSNVQVISHVSLPHIVQLITQEHFALEVGQRAGQRSSLLFTCCGRGALVFYKQLFSSDIDNISRILKLKALFFIVEMHYAAFYFQLQYHKFRMISIVNFGNSVSERMDVIRSRTLAQYALSDVITFPALLLVHC